MFENQLVELTTDIVSAYVSNNSVPAAQLGELIGNVHTSLTGLTGGVVAPAVAQKAAPAVSIKKSVTPSAITCLFDGRKLKSLKRHLAANHDMTPEQYRVHFNLPAAYPMVAPEYAAKRSQLALSLGLGRKAKAPELVAKPLKRPRTKKALPVTAE